MLTERWQPVGDRMLPMGSESQCDTDIESSSCELRQSVLSCDGYSHISLLSPTPTPTASRDCKADANPSPAAMTWQTENCHDSFLSLLLLHVWRLSFQLMWQGVAVSVAKAPLHPSLSSPWLIYKSLNFKILQRIRQKLSFKRNVCGVLRRNVKTVNSFQTLLKAPVEAPSEAAITMVRVHDSGKTLRQFTIICTHSTQPQFILENHLNLPTTLTPKEPILIHQNQGEA